MAIIPQENIQRQYRPVPAVSLEEYAKYISYGECAFFGIRGSDYVDFACRDIWTLDQRNYVQHYLSEAQQELEDELGFFLTADWVVGYLEDERDRLERYTDTLPIVRNGLVYKTRWAKVIAAGVRTVEDIELAAVVDHTSDPALITVTTTVTDVNEIKVFYPDSDIEINPSEIVLSGGSALISIPRCRMIAYENMQNPKAGWTYSDTSLFQATVDVKRVYNGSGDSVIRCSNCGCDCTTTNKAACMRVLDHRMGTVMLSNVSGCSTCVGQNVGLYYYSGELAATQKDKDMVIRLAHSKMPNEPCGCEIATRLWERDRKIPEVLTAERLNCPFGLNDGAWVTWQWTKGRSRVVRFGRA